MKVMVVGGGGREHAIIKKLKENKQITEIFALPGNGGISADAQCVAVKATDIEGICQFAKQNAIDFAVVAPDDPLVLGAVDALHELGIPCFGPDKKSAIIEGSKVFAKQLMKKYAIPTAQYEVFDDAQQALAYVEEAPLPTVIKADGLALGKGVVIAFTREEAREAVIDAMQNKKFGNSGEKIVVEEFLQGVEVSVLAFTDGNTIVPMVSSMDHKRALEGDKGLNTGGMGSVAPNPYYTKAVEEECMQKIFLPTVNAMKSEGRAFKGCLYFGLILTADGAKVIEYNCRFGDPETQVVLPLMESDLFTVMQAVENGTLTKDMVKFSNKSACCVVVASNGYPTKYVNGYPVNLPRLNAGEEIYLAGIKKEGDQLLSNGGRVLGAVAVRETLQQAVDSAYEMVQNIEFSNGYYRKDIGKTALKVLSSK